MARIGAQVRPATAADIPTLRRLYDEFHAFHVRGVPDLLLLPDDPPDDASFSASIEEILTNEQAVLLVAEAEGETVGLAEVYVRDDEASPYKRRRRYAHLQSLAVTERCRRFGIGALLLHEAEAWAEEHGATEIRTDVWEFTEGPLPFYERAGYETLRRTLIKRGRPDNADFKLTHYPRMSDPERHETRPWGEFFVLSDEPGHRVKRIVIHPGRRLSYQRHERRSEHWFVVSGSGRVTLDGEVRAVTNGDSLDVALGVAHRVEAHGGGDLVFIEIQHGSYFGEDDITRLDDDYGRADPDRSPGLPSS